VGSFICAVVGAEEEERGGRGRRGRRRRKLIGMPILPTFSDQCQNVIHMILI